MEEIRQEDLLLKEDAKKEIADEINSVRGSEEIDNSEKENAINENSDQILAEDRVILSNEQGFDYTKTKEYEEMMMLTKQAEEIIMAQKLEEDLMSIKEAYPDVSVESVFELGEQFIRLMQTGVVGPVTAYTAQLAINRRSDEAKQKTPESTGDIKSVANLEKEYFTSDEVDKFTIDDYTKNPTLMDKVRNSMTRWRK